MNNIGGGNRCAIKKLIQVNEEALPPLHVPIVLGHECYIVTQQDVRQVKDVRLISFSRLLANGQLVPVDITPQAAPLHDAVINAYQMLEQQQMQGCYAGQPACGAQLVEALQRMCGVTTQLQQQMPASMTQDNADVTMAATLCTHAQPAIKATLEQQLEWTRAQNIATCASTADLSAPPTRCDQCGGCACQCIQRLRPNVSMRTRATHTSELDETPNRSSNNKKLTMRCAHQSPCLCKSARQQKKERKMANEH